MAEEDFEDLLRRKTSDKTLCVKLLVALWCSGYHYCTTSFNKAWILLQHRLKTSVSDICNYVNLWQWSWMEIRLNIFCQSTILQKQLIPKYFQFGIASNPLNHGYQHGLVSMVYDFFDKKNWKHCYSQRGWNCFWGSRTSPLHKLIARKFQWSKLFSSYRDSVWSDVN